MLKNTDLDRYRFIYVKNYKFLFDYDTIYIAYITMHNYE